MSSVGNITSELSFPGHFRTIWIFCHCTNNPLSLHNRKLSLHILCITAQYFRPWLKRHLLRSHNEGTWLTMTCNICQKKFSNCVYLKQHLLRHEGVKPYVCSECNKSFNTSSNLKQHKRQVHSNRRLYGRQYGCPYCGKLFKTSSELKLHVRIHTGAKPYSCRHCSLRFTRHNQLKTHLVRSHNEGTWLTCNICQKKFTTSTELKRHLRRHEGVKPYVCSQCPKRFCTVRELKCHQVVHSDYKQFSCGLCGKYFKQRHYVVRHFKRCPANPAIR